MVKRQMAEFVSEAEIAASEGVAGVDTHVGPAWLRQLDQNGRDAVIPAISEVDSESVVVAQESCHIEDGGTRQRT